MIQKLQWSYFNDKLATEEKEIITFFQNLNLFYFYKIIIKNIYIFDYTKDGEPIMLISTIAIQDKIQKEDLMKKVDRLCTLHKCSIVELLVLSIDVQAQLNNNKK